MLKQIGKNLELFLEAGQLAGIFVHCKASLHTTFINWLKQEILKFGCMYGKFYIPE